MCYGMFNFGDCCDPVEAPGLMDLFCTTTVKTRLSSTRFFSRSCALNTLALAQNGRQIEPLWGKERVGDDRARSIEQVVASWDGHSVYMREICAPTFIDEDVSMDVNSIGGRNATTYPIVDPSGDGWVVYSGTPTVQLAAFNVLRANVVGTATISWNGQVGAVFALVFRLQDKDNYLRLRFQFGTSNSIVFEKILSGAATTLASAPVSGTFLRNLSYTVTFSLVGSGFGVGVLANDQQQVAFSGVTSVFSSATKFGLYRNGGTNAGINFIQVQSSSSKKMLGFYDAGATAGISGSQDNDDPKYRDNLIAAGKTCFQPMTPQTEDSYFPAYPDDTGLPDGAQFVGGSLSYPLFIGRTTSHFGPVLTNLESGFLEWNGDSDFFLVGEPQGVGGFYAGGSEYDSSGARTYREHRQFATESWQSTGPNIPPDFISDQGPANDFIYRSPMMATRQQLGKEAIGTMAKYGYPKACGVLLRSVDVVHLPTTPGYYAYKIIGHFAMVAGDLTWPDDNTAPSINGGEDIQTWTMEGPFWRSSTYRGFPLDDVPPNENEARLAVNPQFYDPFNTIANLPRIFDCTPGLESYICSIFNVNVTLIPEFVPQTQGNSYVIGSGVNSKIKSGGMVSEFSPDWIFGSYAVSPEAVAVMVTLAQNTQYRLYRGGSPIYTVQVGANGVVGMGVSCMSDRFVYVNILFDTDANARAFSTATLPASLVMPTGSLLRDGFWALSYDGSIRYPLLAADNSQTPKYGQRDKLEDVGVSAYGAAFGPHLFNGGNADCIKNSSIPRSPKLQNPIY